MKTRITMLNVMAGNEFHPALDRFLELGLSDVDLKNQIYGSAVENLTEEQADAAAQALQERRLHAYCLSTELFHDFVEKGEIFFREHHLAKVDHVLQVARRLKPSLIRLLSAQTENRSDIGDSMDYIRRQCPWLISIYQEAIDRIADAGFAVTIENECHRNLWSNPEEIIAFFAALDRSGKVHFTYDVQNLWQMGTYPTLEAYRKLRPIIGFLHLKGGQRGDSGDTLMWKSTLEEASWSVSDIIKEYVRDQVSPVICLNPSHGMLKEGYSYSNMYERDLQYLRQMLQRVEGTREERV